MIEHIFYGKRSIGWIDDENYTSVRETKKHFFIKGRGYPITSTILNKLLHKGVKKISIVEHGVKQIRVYETEIINYINAPEFQEGEFEPQKCFPLKNMKLIFESNPVVI